MNRYEEDNYDPIARRLVEKLHQVPERDEAAVAHGRQRFLSEARSLAGEARRAGAIRPTAVSLTPLQRLNGWIASIFRSNKLKERKPMATILTSMLLVIAILFGGTGATVYAAQDSQPDGLLYPVKTLSEDVRLNLSNDRDVKLDLALDLSNRRIDEMAAMMKKGQEIPEEVFQRYQEHLRLAYQLAADMDDEDLEEAVSKIRRTLRDQDRVMTMTNVPDHAMTVRVEETVRNQIRVLENEVELPLELQFSLRQRMKWLGEEEYNFESPYMYQRGDGEPIQSGDGLNQGEPAQQQGPGSQEGPGYGSEDPGSGNSSEGSGPDDKGPGTGNNHQSSPDPQKNGKSD
ncbi:MAG: DUF5667 domain-containing protein [Anaerolineales bacterium]